MRRRGPKLEVCCVCCDEVGSHSGRGLCSSCYKRHNAAGTLEAFPKLRTSMRKLGRLEDFAELRQRGLTVKQAATQLGVDPRTGSRYLVQLRKQELAAAS